MVPARRSRVWLRFAAALTFALALVAVPTGVVGSLEQAGPSGQLAPLGPVAAHGVVAVLRAVPTIAPAATKHATTDWVLAAPVGLAALAFGWMIVRRRRPMLPASRLLRAIAARAPPSTVGI
jgi:hypothetical protein